MSRTLSSDPVIIDSNALVKKWNKLQRNRAIQQAIGEGRLSVAEIASQFGLSTSAVYSRRRTLGLTSSQRVRRQSKLRRKGHTPQLTDAVAQALTEGHTIQEVSKVIHIPPYTISQMLRDVGIEPSRPDRYQPPPERAFRTGPRRRKEKEESHADHLE